MGRKNRKKTCYSIFKRLRIATDLVYSRLGYLGLAFTYCKAKKWNSIEVAIKKVIKASGLDRLIHDETLYQISTRLSPKLMAVKQVLQLGLKIVDCEQIKNTRLCKLRLKLDKGTRSPFMSLFEKEFNNLGLDLRKELVDENLNISKDQKKRNERIKCLLKKHFLKISEPHGRLKLKDLRELILSNLYKRPETEDNPIIRFPKDSEIVDTNITREPESKILDIKDFRVTRQHRKFHRRK